MLDAIMKEGTYPVASTKKGVDYAANFSVFTSLWRLEDLANVRRKKDEQYGGAIATVDARVRVLKALVTGKGGENQQ
ncbi:hypothetical protein GOP47_0014922 [Adiantum capillus-veneris]|uniref:Uncharacterized protein n=1 Tax=Adiantum capillus-veneris TaxID=13818 RepID=A0A9D4UMF6_ADICA|nr:hypothetical protein GOP47_0014922 [Adiantum capillus-veneris]